jgi:hypothetical protein
VSLMSSWSWSRGSEASRRKGSSAGLPTPATIASHRAVAKAIPALLGYFFGDDVVRIEGTLRDVSALSAIETMCRVVANGGHRIISTKSSLT